MTKPYKLYSKASMAAILATAAIVPAATASAEAVQTDVATVVFEQDGKTLSLPVKEYNKAKALGTLDGTQEVKYVTDTKGNSYLASDYKKAFALNGKDKAEALNKLAADNKQQDLPNITEGKIVDGKVVGDGTPSTKEDLAKEIEAAKAALEEVDADKKEDLEEAIKAAQEVVEKEDATAEEIAAAVKALEEAVATAKGEEPAEAIAVESVKAINTSVDNGTAVTSIINTLGKTVKGQLNDEAKTEVELNVEWSAPEDFDANKAGEYTFTGKVTVADEEATYTIGEDVVATAVVTVKEETYINNFTKVTTALVAGDTTFTVAATDQYDEVVKTITPDDVTIKGTLNGTLPVTGTIDANGQVTLKLPTDVTLAEADEVELTFTVKKGEEVKSTTKLAYTVEKAEASTLEALTVKADKTNVPSGEAITFTAEAKNQYNNTITTIGENTALAYTWLVNGEVVDGQTAATYTFNETEPGEYTVTVVSKQNTKKFATQKVVVDAAALKEVSVKKNDTVVNTVEAINTEATTIGTVDYTKGAAVTAEDVKFDIVASDDVTDKDIEVVAEADELGNIEIKATVAKDKSGSYKIIPYVMYGEEKVAAQEITLTSKKSDKLASISDFAFDAKELKVNSTITKEVTLTNVNGETLVVGEGKDITKDKLTTSVVASDTKNKEALKVNLNDTDKDGKTTLTFKATAADTYVVTLTGGSDFTPVTKTLKFVAPTVTTIEAGADVTGLVATETKTHFQPISFADQDGVAIDVAKTDALTVEVTQLDGKAIAEGNATLPTVSFVEIDKDGKKVESGTKANAVAVSAEAADEGTYTIAVSYKVDDKTTVTDTFKVVVGEARQATTVTVAPTSTTIAKGASSDFTVELLDQYEVPFNVTKANDITVAQKVAEGQKAAVTVEKVAQAQKDGKNVAGSYKFTANVSATADTGNYTLVVTVPTADGKSITKEVTVKVDAGSNLATDIVVTGENIENGVAKLPVQVGKGLKLVNSKDEAYTLGLDVLDADGKKINYKASDVIWTSKTKGVTINADGIAVEESVFAEGKTTADITLNAKYFGLNKDIKLTVSNEESTIQEGTLVAKQVKEEGKDPVEVTTVVIDKDAKDGVVELTFTGVDQFGKEVDAKELGLLSFDTSVATVAEAEEGKVQITAVKAGKTTAEVTIDNATTVLNIEVTAEAAEAAKAKADAEKEEAEYTSAGVLIETSTTYYTKSDDVYTEANEFTAGTTYYTQTTPAQPAVYDKAEDLTEFAADTTYYTKSDDVYTEVEADAEFDEAETYYTQTTPAQPAVYDAGSVLVATGTTYYTKSGDVYTEATTFTAGTTYYTKN